MPQSERRLTGTRPAIKTEVIGPFRVSPEDREAIYERARERNMDVTSYVTDAALGRLAEDLSSDAIWRDDVERRIERLESLAFGTG